MSIFSLQTALILKVKAYAHEIKNNNHRHCQHILPFNYTAAVSKFGLSSPIIHSTAPYLQDMYVWDV